MKNLYNIIHKNDSLYLIRRVIPEHMFTFNKKLELDAVKQYRDHLGCDHVLREQSNFMFVETIEEAKIDEECLELT